VPGESSVKSNVVAPGEVVVATTKWLAQLPDVVDAQIS
jgi:hypothetical protein